MDLIHMELNSVVHVCVIMAMLLENTSETFENKLVTYGFHFPPYIYIH
jgi:hypothetical protein